MFKFKHNRRLFRHWLIDYRHAWVQLDMALTRAEHRLLRQGSESDANSMIVEIVQLAERAGSAGWPGPTALETARDLARTIGGTTAAEG
jgi:hypothetical protein